MRTGREGRKRARGQHERMGEGEYAKRDKRDREGRGVGPDENL